MFSFLYFLQLLNNWPKLLVISWNTMTSTSTSPLTIKVAFLSDKNPEVWNSINDISSMKNTIVQLSICNEVKDDYGLTYYWQILQNDAVDRTTNTRNCSIDFLVDSESNYHAKVTVTSKTSVLHVAEADIPSGHTYWLAAIGDSFSSGQGNPDIPAQNDSPATWMDKKCYRSSKAFPFLTFQSLSNPSALTFLSCSGASVDDGILSKNGQLDTLETLSKKRRRSPDALLLTVGGNDIGFTDIISTFQQGTTLDASIDMRFFYVSHQLDLVAARIAELKISRVILVLYYDITRNENGVVDSSCGLFGKVSVTNLQIAERQILQKLNNLLMRKAKEFGWVTVDTSDIFRNRGVCSSYSLIRSRNESLLLQGNEYGSFHPNSEAHELISRRLLNYIRT